MTSSPAPVLAQLRTERDVTMYLDRIHRRLAELAELGCVEADDQVPCTEEEVAALEQKLGFHLPRVVRELYLWGGNELGGVFGRMDVLDLKQQMKWDYRSGARETIAEAGEEPALLDAPALVVQTDCDGQFSFVRADQGDDPPVYTHPDNEPTFCSCERLSDYLALMVEQCADIERIELVRSVEELDCLAVPDHEVFHLLFAGGLDFGTVPDRVFDFKELRSLNLVGKGLLELSPRLGELPFLKRLDLARNSHTSLPMALAELNELEELDLADNQLSTVIGVLRNLPALRRCWLAGNPLAEGELNELRRELPRVEFIAEQR